MFKTHIVCICMLGARSCTSRPVHAWKHRLRADIRISIHCAILSIRRIFRCTTDGYFSCEKCFIGSFSLTLDSSLVAVIGGLCISVSLHWAHVKVVVCPLVTGVYCCQRRAPPKLIGLRASLRAQQACALGDSSGITGMYYSLGNCSIGDGHTCKAPEMQCGAHQSSRKWHEAELGP